ncbi:MAG: glycosyltransferase family 2 protein [Spirochaetales bacterium]|nr:glycosyltransferase family 2 protein [Spirochaetales bacterium]
MNWIIFFIISLDIFAFGIIFAAGVCCRFYPIYYKKKYPPASGKQLPGSVAIFIPCKGVSPQFEQNIQKNIKLADEKIRIFFIVENSTDPAYYAVKKNINENSRAFILEAGVSTTCSQKNFNLIKGIEASGQKDDIYIFMDSDTDFTREKLVHLLTPLYDPAIDASSGFQWNILKKKNFGDRFMSFLIATQWMNLNFPAFKWIWGGAMAIKRESFEKMNTKEYWSRSVVDDISLVFLIKKNKKNVCFVPLAINEQHQGITSVKKAMSWYQRQYLYLKYYTFPLWLLGIATFVFLSGKKWLFPIVLLAAVFFNPSLVFPLLCYSFILLFSEMFLSIFMKRPCHDNFALPVWVILTPFFTALSIIPIIMTIFPQKLVWAGIRYSIGRNGIVVDIQRQ